MLDVTDLPPVKVGDEVTVFGGKICRWNWLRSGQVLSATSWSAASVRGCRAVMCATKSESALKTLSLVMSALASAGRSLFICKAVKAGGVILFGIAAAICQ